MARVVLTGATGFMGRRVAATLADGGTEVVAVARRAQDGPWSELVAADVGSPEFDLPIRRGDLVVHAAGLAHDVAGRMAEQEYRRVNARGAANVAAAAAGGGARGFVLLSSTKAMAETTSAEGIDESSPCLPQTPYGRSKLAGEQLVSTELAGSGCDLTVLRLAPVYGPGSKGNLDRLVRLVRRRSVPWLPERSGRRSVVHVDDVAELVVALEDRLVAGTFVVEEGRTYTPREVQELVRGRRPRTGAVVVPRAAILAAGRGGTALARLAPALGRFTERDASRLLDHAVYRGDRLRSATAWRPRRSLDQELAGQALATTR